MKTMLFVFVALFSFSVLAQVEPCETGPGNNCAGYSLECTYQAYLNYSADARQLDLNLDKTITLYPNKPVRLDLKGNHTNKKYTILLGTHLLGASRNSDGTGFSSTGLVGIELDVSVYEDFNGTSTSFTGKDVTSINGVFGENQSSLRLMSRGGAGLTSVYCRIK